MTPKPFVTCPHCRMLQPSTACNGDILTCKDCGMISQITGDSFEAKTSTHLSERAQRIEEIKRRINVGPMVKTATERKMWEHYVSDVEFLLELVGENSDE